MATDSVQTLVAQGEKAFRSGKYQEAAALFSKAAGEYVMTGDKIKVAEMANNRSVALLQAGDAQGAYEAALGTDLVFAQASDVRRQGMALGNQAAALEGLGRLDEALTRYKQCNDLLKRINDQEYRPMVLKSISALQIRTGHQMEALASMDAALTNQKKLSIKERLLKKLIHVPFEMLNRR